MHPPAAALSSRLAWLPAETAVFLEEIAVSQTPKRLEGLMRVGLAWAAALVGWAAQRAHARAWNVHAACLACNHRRRQRHACMCQYAVN